MPLGTLSPSCAVLTPRHPRFSSALIDDLVSQSLQSKEQVLRAASYFDIPSATLAPNLKMLEDIFRARNEIVHEIDNDAGEHSYVLEYDHR